MPSRDRALPPEPSWIEANFWVGTPPGTPLPARQILIRQACRHARNHHQPRRHSPREIPPLRFKIESTAPLDVSVIDRQDITAKAVLDAEGWCVIILTNVVGVPVTSHLAGLFEFISNAVIEGHLFYQSTEKGCRSNRSVSRQRSEAPRRL
jgi:hypothetical protein